MLFSVPGMWLRQQLRFVLVRIAHIIIQLLWLVLVASTLLAAVAATVHGRHLAFGLVGCSRAGTIIYICILAIVLLH